MSIQEEELMALYGIAKDEIEGISEASERLEKAIQKLERVESTIGMYSHRGIEECLTAFKRESSLTLSQEIKDVSSGLRMASMAARNQLDRFEWFYIVGFFVLGVIFGLGGMWWWMSDRLASLESGQNVIYRELLSLKHPVKVHKPKVKHKSTKPTQSNEEDESGTSSAGGEEQSQ